MLDDECTNLWPDPCTRITDFLQEPRRTTMLSSRSYITIPLTDPCYGVNCQARPKILSFY